MKTTYLLNRLKLFVGTKKQDRKAIGTSPEGLWIQIRSTCIGRRHDSGILFTYNQFSRENTHCPVRQRLYFDTSYAIDLNNFVKPLAKISKIDF